MASFLGLRLASLVGGYSLWSSNCGLKALLSFIPVGHRTGASSRLVVGARYYLLRCVGSRWSGRSALRQQAGSVWPSATPAHR
ncbi:hypothetical protein SapgrDRAFT_0347 [Saprospira grandis DSM 2844]|uniref:Uncharacterized protein n=1 Tax=Saprospira grandis DSM 2844 TaxID=694433 RepID=J1I1E7_9BACT|nr:hypothetical protein SapgrDRAFT_0347 [Saprospira grandis DSM 2844]